MTREIKFRGWSKDLKKWIKGDLVRIPKDLGNYNEPPSQELKTCITNSHALTFPLMDVDIISVGQFTGLKDKKEVEIYEGDIAYDKFGRKCVVEWVAEHSSLACKIIGDIEELKGLYYSVSNISLIIGNIYENPKLIQTP